MHTHPLAGPHAPGLVFLVGVVIELWPFLVALFASLLLCAPNKIQQRPFAGPHALTTARTRSQTRPLAGPHAPGLRVQYNVHM